MKHIINNILSYTLIAVCCLCSLEAINAQRLTPINPPLQIDGERLAKAWDGGLNAPQLSAIDLNGDGFQDLHIFDRAGDVQLTYLHEGIAGSTNYQYAPEYVKLFPEVQNWMLLQDYNTDGILDIFCYSDIPGIDGLAVYTGKMEAGVLSFERFKFNAPFNLASFRSNTGNVLQIYISKIDYPAIADIDCDGDLDILTFNISGGYTEWYKNLSIEQGFGLDSLIFTLSDPCWGGFYESGISTDIDLSEKPGTCFVPPNQDLAVTYRHTGSTLMLFDPDLDGDQDLVLGDLSFNNLNFLNNGGDCGEAWMNRQDQNYPTPDFPVALPSFPISFYLDIDQDGEEDLMAAPNARQGSEDRSVLWYYKGSRDDAGKGFQFIKKSFLVDEMLDLGTGAHPSFVDYNADGLMDMVIGNQQVYFGDGQIRSQLFLFENVGTKETPEYQLVDDNYLGMRTFNPSSYGFTPNFEDLDGDGDVDVIIGEVFGQLYFGENTAGPNAPIDIKSLLFGYKGIDVGINSAPQIVDINGDGLADLLIGERSGNVNYFENIGTKLNPEFNPDPNAGNNQAFFGGIDARSPGLLAGNSKPFAVKAGGKAHVFCGSESGQLFHFESEDDDFRSPLSLENGTLFENKVGSQSAVSLADINGDGLFEFLIGNERGGLNFFKSDFQKDISTSIKDNDIPFPGRVYPNPVRNWLRIEHNEGEGNLSVIGLDGKIVLKQAFQSKLTELNTAAWIPGVYFLQIQDKNGVYTKKVLVQ